MFYFFVWSFKELDMTSTFVTKAALIAKRKMEQRPKPERKEKKVPVKESKTVPDRSKEEPEVQNCNSYLVVLSFYYMG